MYLLLTDHKQYDGHMDEKLRDENDNKDYEIFKDELDSIEVAEENPAKQHKLEPPKSTRKFFRGKQQMIIIALVLLCIVAIIAGTLFAITKKPNKKAETTYIINTQTLDNGTLNQLVAENGGTGKQQLTISPDTLFQNSVTINKDLTVKGQTFLQSAVTISKDLGVNGNVGVGGNLSVNGLITAGNLNVGSVTIGNLRLSGDLEFNGHLMPKGAVPTIKASTAAASGTATIEGSDTVGSLTITVGGSPFITGEMAVITFRTKFSGNPRVQLTPASAAASKLDYFVTQSAGFFTIETTSLPTAGGTYSFYYFVTQ